MAILTEYKGVSQARMMKEFKGEVVYNQEVCFTVQALFDTLKVIRISTRSINTSLT